MTPVGTSVRRGPARLRHLIRRASGLERVFYASIGRAILRRPDVPKGATGLSYHRGGLPLLIVFIVVSTVELAVIDLIVHRWLPVRIVLDMLGAWGLIWGFGLLCAHLMRPHTVGPDGIRIRNGLDLDVRVDWDDVHSVGIRKHICDPGTPRVAVTAGGDGARTLTVSRQSETTIEIVLERPAPIRLPGGGDHTIAVARLWADDPRAFLAAVRPFLRPAPQPD